MINRFCGWDHFDYISQSNDVNIKFRSDRSFEDSGFLLDFKPVDKGMPKFEPCARDFQQCGILTCVDSDEPLQSPLSVFVLGREQT